MADTGRSQRARRQCVAAPVRLTLLDLWGGLSAIGVAMAIGCELGRKLLNETGPSSRVVDGSGGGDVLAPRILLKAGAGDQPGVPLVGESQPRYSGQVPPLSPATSANRGPCVIGCSLGSGSTAVALRCRCGIPLSRSVVVAAGALLLISLLTLSMSTDDNYESRRSNYLAYERLSTLSNWPHARVPAEHAFRPVVRTSRTPGGRRTRPRQPPNRALKLDDRITWGSVTLRHGRCG